LAGETAAHNAGRRALRFGMLGRKIGRRRILALIGLAGFNAGPILYYVLVRSGYQSALQVIQLVTLINLCAS
jgi:hypothetical protein